MNEVVAPRSDDEVDAGRDRAGRRRRSYDALHTAYNTPETNAHTFMIIRIPGVFQRQSATPMSTLT